MFRHLVPGNDTSNGETNSPAFAMTPLLASIDTIRRMQVPFDNSYVRLPPRFYSKLAPVPVARPRMVRINRPLAEQLGIDPAWLESDDGVAMIAGNRLPDGADPIAMVYAGHQFGGWVPQLGDGRALLLGEIIGNDGERYDIQLKGSGQTPYSRSGDGRAPLGPVLREYLVSEAMAALGVPTTRTLAAVTSGEPVFREQAFPGGVLARVGKSHIRIGTFQFFAAREDTDGLRALVDHVVARHYPDAVPVDNPALALFDGVIARQAELIARWQCLGFIHGVMNTDNMLLSGETIDYGPCAFMDDYDPQKVFSSIDQQGRYAYANQPAIAHWNLACLGQSLLTLFDPDEETAVEAAQQALDRFPDLVTGAMLDGFRAKLGLASAENEDAVLLQDLLDLLKQQHADFTLAFRRLAELPGKVDGVATLFDFGPAYADWLEAWRARCARDELDDASRGARMLAASPALIPRNHRVEAAISAAYEGDFNPFHRLTERLENPYDYGPGDEIYARPPTPEQAVLQTFCGT